MNLHVLPEFAVLDETDDWVVVNKPAPLIVHPANRQAEPTLLGGLERLLSYEIANGGAVAIVNRLDRETSGLVLVAKTTAAARELGGIFERREAEKEYLAVVAGWPPADFWRCDAPIARAGDLGPSEIWVRQQVSPQGRECATRFRTERRFESSGRRFALIRCFPETGRMHQLRVHLAHCGFPILGDKLYSGSGAEYLEWMANGWNESLAARLLLPRHALHAADLRLPWRGQTVRWHAPLAPDLADFLAGREIVPDPGIVIWNRDR
jgi:23S rRNA pseudouridine1911/1915/1917 synthase